jgi:hypothetical protein
MDYEVCKNVTGKGPTYSEKHVHTHVTKRAIPIDLPNVSNSEK